MNEPNGPVNGSGEQIIAVDVAKLSQGLKIAFEGVSMIFDSLGVEMDANISDTSGRADKAENTGKSPNKGTNEGEADFTDTDITEEETESATVKQKPEHAAASITADDVTKVIVQKIRKDRSNNEKIGQILKTFSVGKVSDLPADKYEAFLTDLAAL